MPTDSKRQGNRWKKNEAPDRKNEATTQLIRERRQSMQKGKFHRRIKTNQRGGKNNLSKIQKYVL